MRIHALRLAGMGPFADEQTIDFDRLGEAGMFLLEGPTGVGKSTIIDAIVFALYGKVAGTDADDLRLVSHFREPSDEPFVEMVFSTATGTYLVRRSPAHPRPRRRGNDTGDLVDQAASATLRRLAGPGDPDGEVLAARPQDVGMEIQTAVGLDRQQFVRTIVLPQGEFSTFLRANSRDRLPILQRIFRTHLYQDLQQRLKDLGKDARTQCDAAENAVSAAIEKFRGALGTDAPDELAGDSPAAVIGATLDVTLAELDRAASQSADALAAAEARVRQARTDLEGVDRRRAHRDTLRDALGRLNALQSRTPAIDAARDQLEIGARAERVADALERSRTATAAAESAETDLADARTGAPPDLARGSGADVEAAQHSIVDAIRSLQPALEQEAALPRLQAEAAAQLESAAAASRQLTEVTERIDAIPAERQLASRALRASRDIAATRSERSMRLADLRKRAAAAEQVVKAQPVEQRLRASVAVLLQQTAEADAETQRRTAAYRAGIAAIIGQHLEPNVPCPACGSEEHPDPAVPGDGHASAEDVDAADAEARRLRAALGKADSALNEQRLELQRLRTAAEGVTAETARQVVAEAERALDAAERADLEAAAHEEALHALETESVDLAATEAKAQEQRTRGLTRAHDLQAEVSARVRVVEAHRGDCSSVARRVGSLEARAEQCRTLIAAHTKRDRAADALDDAQRALANALMREGFADAESAAAGRLEPSLSEELQQSVREHQQAEIEVAAILERPELVGVDPEERIEREPAAEALKNAEGEVRSASTEAAQAAQTARLAHTHASALRNAAQHRDAVAAGSETAILLSKVAEGNNPLRIDLATFVLVHRFRSVIEAANLHLTRMSNGRLLWRRSRSRCARTSAQDSASTSGTCTPRRCAARERCRAAKPSTSRWHSRSAWPRS